MAFKRILMILLFLTGFPALGINEPPAGILITKPSPDSPDTESARIIEFQSITEHLVPATDYVTVIRPGGDRDDIPKKLILRRVDYPSEPNRNIVSAAALADVTALVQDLQAVVSKYPQSQPFLEPKISVLQKEVDLFNLGARKLNGSWISSAEFQRLIAEEQRRKQAVIEEKRRAEAEAAALKQRDEMLKAETKRKAELQAALEARQKADTQAALEARQKADALLKKKKADALKASQMPAPSFLSTFPLWRILLFFLILGGGFFALIKIMRGKSGPASLATLDWPKFELLVAEIYRRRGYAVEISSGFGSEDGIDMKLTRGDETTLVQCKHWKMLKDYKVGAQEIMSLYQIVANEPGQQGIFVSTGEYRDDAREFVEGKPIVLMGVADVDRLIPQVVRLNENLLNIKSWVAEFIANAKIVDPVCPKCHKPMLLKTARNGSPAWKCPDFPVCEGKLDARVDLVRQHVIGGA